MTKKKKTKKNNDCGQPLSEDALSNFYAGLGSDFLDIARLRVRCPVEGCGFECNSFGEMNIHMRTVHPERC